jgi:hypothetical protein
MVREDEGDEEADIKGVVKRRRLEDITVREKMVRVRP